MSTTLFASLAALRAAPTARAPRGASVRAAAGDGDPSPRDKAIWENKNVRMWDVDLEAEFERQERRKREEEERNRKEAASGLGFGNLAMLDDMSVDLSSQLRRADDVDEDEDAPLAIGDGTSSSALARGEEEEAPPGNARVRRARGD